MKNKHRKYRRYSKHVKHPFNYLKVLKLVVTAVLLVVAIRLALLGGSVISGYSETIVKKVDVDILKSAMNYSYPIIHTTYNSGNISVSFSGELSNVIKFFFEFDPGSPETIFSAASPYFDLYYNNEYKNLAQNNGGNYTPPEMVIPQSETKEPPKESTITDASSISTEDSSEQKKNTNDIVSEGKISIANETNYKIDINSLLAEPLNIKFDKKGPKVLIYHTHTSERYLNNASEIGKSGIPSRSTDPRYSVVRVGEELAQNLKKLYGIEVIHNGSVHDYPNYNGAYGKSLNTVEKILKSYPSIKVVLDIHRDAMGDDGNKLRVATKVNNKSASQVMFVIGTNGNGLEHPNWRENLKLAVKMQQKLNEDYPGITRPIDLSKNRYNQHVTNGALIIEVGGDGNLLGESLESTKYLAKVINDVLNANK